MPAGISGATLAGIAASAASVGASAYSASQAGANIPGATPTRGAPTTALQTPGIIFDRSGPGAFAFGVTRNPLTQSYLDALRAGGTQATDAFTSNINSLTPGFGAVTDARVNAIRNAAQKATSDLSGNLAQRHILGSSFGQNAVAQVTQQAGVDEANARAQSYLEELQANTNLINQRFNVVTSIAKQELDQTNFETTAGVNLLNGTQQIFQDNAGVIGQLAAANAAGAGAGLQTGLYGANGQPGLLQYLTGALSGIGGAGGGATASGGGLTTIGAAGAS